MMGQLFRGHLEVNQQGATLNGQKVDFMFNPTEYAISKSNRWEPKANKSGNVPKWEFGGGDPRQMTIELFFDSYLPRNGVQANDVRTKTNMLFKFMMIDKKLKGSKSKMGQPPRCRLVWGQDSKYHFDCYIMSCNVRYLMFNENGIPVRATASLTLKEVADPEDLGGTNPTSLGEPGRRVHEVSEGDRLDWIAYQEYNDAREWRRIAEANHITNPLALRPGMMLVIPPR
jgi:Contractile injection system tube protein/LysM domain